MKVIGDFLHRASSCLLLGTMAVAPWLLGTVPPWAIHIVLCLLGAAGVCWGAGMFLRGGDRRPPVNIATMLAGALLVQGFWMAAHPVSAYNPATRSFENFGNMGLLAGSVDGYSSRLAMLSLGVLFLAFHVALDHAQGGGTDDPQAGGNFRRRLAWVAAGTGASIALLGILQCVGVTSLLLAHMSPKEGQPFGPFNYHVSAGAFLLLTLPLAGVLAARAWAAGKTGQGITASAMAAVIFAGLFVNTARGTALLVVPLTVAVGLAIWRMLAPILPGVGTRHGRKTWWLIGAGVAVALLGGLALTSTLMPAKWALLRQQISWQTPRMILWRIGAGMAVDAGWLGFGPGTFNLLLPVSPRFDPALYRVWIVTYHTPGGPVSIWSRAHNEPLQAIIEWGYVGGMMWLALAALTLAAGWRACRRKTGGSVTGRLVTLGMLAGVLAVFACGLFDSPLQALLFQVYTVCLAAVLWAEGGIAAPRAPAREK